MTAAHQQSQQEHQPPHLHNRVKRECMCDLGKACYGMSTAFAVMKDARGAFIKLPTATADHDGAGGEAAAVAKLRAMYRRYLQRRRQEEEVPEQQQQPEFNHHNDDLHNNNTTTSSRKEQEELYVAVHHFHPRVIDCYFDTTFFPNSTLTTANNNKKEDNHNHNIHNNNHNNKDTMNDTTNNNNDLIPFPTKLLREQDIQELNVAVSHLDLSSSVSKDGYSSYYYNIPPSYKFELAHLDLKHSMHHHLYKIQLAEQAKRAQRESRRNELRKVLEESKERSSIIGSRSSRRRGGSASVTTVGATTTTQQPQPPPQQQQPQQPHQQPQQQQQQPPNKVPTVVVKTATPNFISPLKEPASQGPATPPRSVIKSTEQGAAVDDDANDVFSTPMRPTSSPPSSSGRPTGTVGREAVVVDDNDVFWTPMRPPSSSLPLGRGQQPQILESNPTFETAIEGGDNYFHDSPSPSFEILEQGDNKNTLITVMAGPSPAVEVTESSSTTATEAEADATESSSRQQQAPQPQRQSQPQPPQSTSPTIKGPTIKNSLLGTVEDASDDDEEETDFLDWVPPPKPATAATTTTAAEAVQSAVRPQQELEQQQREQQQTQQQQQATTATATATADDKEEDFLDWVPKIPTTTTTAAAAATATTTTSTVDNLAKSVVQSQEEQQQVQQTQQQQEEEAVTARDATSFAQMPWNLFRQEPQEQQEKQEEQQRQKQEATDTSADSDNAAAAAAATEVATTEIEKIEIAPPEIAATHLEKADIEKTDVAATDIEKTDIAPPSPATEINKEIKLQNMPAARPAVTQTDDYDDSLRDLLQEKKEAILVAKDESSHFDDDEDDVSSMSMSAPHHNSEVFSSTEMQEPSLSEYNKPYNIRMFYAVVMVMALLNVQYGRILEARKAAALKTSTDGGPSSMVVPDTPIMTLLEGAEGPLPEMDLDNLAPSQLSIQGADEMGTNEEKQQPSSWFWGRSSSSPVATEYDVTDDKADLKEAEEREQQPQVEKSSDDESLPSSSSWFWGRSKSSPAATENATGDVAPSAEEESAEVLGEEGQDVVAEKPPEQQETSSKSWFGWSRGSSSNDGGATSTTVSDVESNARADEDADAGADANANATEEDPADLIDRAEEISTSEAPQGEEKMIQQAQSSWLRRKLFGSSSTEQVIEPPEDNLTAEKERDVTTTTVMPEETIGGIADKTERPVEVNDESPTEIAEFADQVDEETPAKKSLWLWGSWGSSPSTDSGAADVDTKSDKESETPAETLKIPEEAADSADLSEVESDSPVKQTDEKAGMDESAATENDTDSTATESGSSWFRLSRKDVPKENNPSEAALDMAERQQPEDALDVQADDSATATQPEQAAEKEDGEQKKEHSEKKSSWFSFRSSGSTNDGGGVIQTVGIAETSSGKEGEALPESSAFSAEEKNDEAEPIADLNDSESELRDEDMDDQVEASIVELEDAGSESSTDTVDTHAEIKKETEDDKAEAKTETEVGLAEANTETEDAGSEPAGDGKDTNPEPSVESKDSPAEPTTEAIEAPDERTIEVPPEPTIESPAETVIEVQSELTIESPAGPAPEANEAQTASSTQAAAVEAESEANSKPSISSWFGFRSSGPASDDGDKGHVDVPSASTLPMAQQENTTSDADRKLAPLTENETAETAKDGQDPLAGSANEGLKPRSSWFGLRSSDRPADESTDDDTDEPDSTSGAPPADHNEEDPTTTEAFKESGALDETAMESDALDEAVGARMDDGAVTPEAVFDSNMTEDGEKPAKTGWLWQRFFATSGDDGAGDVPVEGTDGDAVENFKNLNEEASLDMDQEQLNLEKETNDAGPKQETRDIEPMQETQPPELDQVTHALEAAQETEDLEATPTVSPPGEHAPVWQRLFYPSSSVKDEDDNEHVLDDKVSSPGNEMKEQDVADKDKDKPEGESDTEEVKERSPIPKNLAEESKEELLDLDDPGNVASVDEDQKPTKTNVADETDEDFVVLDDSDNSVSAEEDQEVPNGTPISDDESQNVSSSTPTGKDETQGEAGNSQDPDANDNASTMTDPTADSEPESMEVHAEENEKSWSLRGSLTSWVFGSASKDSESEMAEQGPIAQENNDTDDAHVFEKGSSEELLEAPVDEEKFPVAEHDKLSEAPADEEKDAFVENNTETTWQLTNKLKSWTGFGRVDNVEGTSAGQPNMEAQKAAKKSEESKVTDPTSESVRSLEEDVHGEDQEVIGGAEEQGLGAESAEDSVVEEHGGVSAESADDAGILGKWKGVASSYTQYTKNALFPSASKTEMDSANESSGVATSDAEYVVSKSHEKEHNKIEPLQEAEEEDSAPEENAATEKGGILGSGKKILSSLSGLAKETLLADAPTEEPKMPDMEKVDETVPESQDEVEVEEDVTMSVAAEASGEDVTKQEASKDDDSAASEDVATDEGAENAAPDDDGGGILSSLSGLAKKIILPEVPKEEATAPDIMEKVPADVSDEKVAHDASVKDDVQVESDKEEELNQEETSKAVVSEEVAGPQSEEPTVEEEQAMTRIDSHTKEANKAESQEEGIINAPHTTTDGSKIGNIFKRAIVAWYNSGFALESTLLCGGVYFYFHRR